MCKVLDMWEGSDGHKEVHLAQLQRCEMNVRIHPYYNMREIRCTTDTRWLDIKVGIAKFFKFVTESG